MGSLGISSVIVSFTLLGSLMLWTLSPTKVTLIQAEIEESMRRSGETTKLHTYSTDEGSSDHNYGDPPHFRQSYGVEPVVGFHEKRMAV